MGILDSILALMKQQPSAAAATGPAINMTAGGVNIPVPGVSGEGSNMQGSSAVPAMLSSAIANPPVTPPQLSPQRGLFAGDTPPPGQPYTPPSMPDKLLRVASLASSIAPFVGEGARQQQAGEFQAEQAQRGRQLDMQQQQQQFQHGLQSQQESRAEQSFPLAQQEAQNRIANTRSPEQLADINSNEVEATPLGQFFKVNKYRGTATPVTMEGGNGTPLLTTPKSQRYTVQTDPKNSYPTAVVDNFTKQVAYPGTPEFNADPAIKQAYDASMAGYNQMRTDKVNDEDHVASRSDARLGATINAAAARQETQHNFEMAKPTAQEEQRADMANNLTDNIEAMEDIVRRRPELFGPGAGRMTAIKSFIGTGDKDIAALKTLKNFAGTAAVTAHSMRSSFGIKDAADAMANTNWQDKPEAILAALEKAKKSASSFQQPPIAQHPGLMKGVPGAPTSAGNSAPTETYVRDPKTGKLVLQNAQ